MTDYTFSIVVHELSQEQAFQASELDGCLGGGATAGVPYVEFELETEMPEYAVDAAIRGLTATDLEPVRIDVDAITIAGIAERTGATRQAVRMWVEGERRAGFPMPYSFAHGLRTWLWADVYPWLRSNSVDINAEYSVAPLPARLIQRYNGKLAEGAGTFSPVPTSA